MAIKNIFETESKKNNNYIFPLKILEMRKAE